MRVVFTSTGACVRAFWLGEVRTVFAGTVYECIAYVRDAHNVNALGCKAATQDDRIISCEVCEVCG